MGTIVVNFMGICTHFTQDIPVPHRVVLVNATAGPTIDGVAIPPHFPKIEFPNQLTSQTQTVTLTGLTIAVTNPATAGITGSLSALPNLTAMMSGVEALTPLSPGCVLEQIPQWATCYFDVTSGAFSTVTQPDGSIDAMLTVETTGDPVLSFTPFPNTSLPAGLFPSMTFGGDSTVVITISNEAPMSEENQPDSHFLLHYLTATQLPTVPQVPPAVQLLTESVGGGCSNSIYP